VKKKILLIFIISGIKIFLWSNPVDDTPIVRFSELVFDKNNNWTIELYLPFPYRNTDIQQVDVKMSNLRAKIKTKFLDGIYIYLITADSLSTRQSINRNGDKIEIWTYLIIDSVRFARIDTLVFGDYPGASVGKPVNGYSIGRIVGELNENPWEIDYLTKNPSLGILNDTLGLTGIMKGRIYDINKNIITKFEPGGYYFELEEPLVLSMDSTYLTKIYPNIYKPGRISVKAIDFPAFAYNIEIDSFDLVNIHPDTLVIQDIYLKSKCWYCELTNVENWKRSTSINELELINYPNPFNSSTNFFIKIPYKMKNETASINIFNTNGQLIKSILVNNKNNVYWDGKDMNGNIVSTGIYYYRLNIDKQVMKSGSMILLK
jgi:hypothetical protein